MPEVTNSSATEISAKYLGQRKFFDGGNTRSYSFRKEQLSALKRAIKQYEEDIIQALHQDFNKPPFESYATEIGLAYEEVNLVLKKHKRWMSARRIPTPLSAFPSKSFKQAEPKGVCLVIAPWNYPFQLLMNPLIAALAAGNTVILKLPEQAPAVSAIVKKIVEDTFAAEYVTTVEGEGHVVVPELMKNRFDHVFFTGGIAVGKKIAHMAADNLSPLTLELGGKSPAIVDETVDLKVAARRLAFGKWVNAGQTCVAPDYILVHQSIRDKLIDELRMAISEFYGSNPLQSKDLASIINRSHFDRLHTYFTDGRIVIGGQVDEVNLRMAPTVMTDVDLQSQLMQQEIFGPVLPILTYNSFEEVKSTIDLNPYPLSLYIFSRNKKLIEKIRSEIAFGGGAINNAIVQLSNPHLPFGGIGYSGYGNYHGKAGFDTFSHYKAMMHSGTWFDLPQKYPPYGKFAYKLVRWLMK